MQRLTALAALLALALTGAGGAAGQTLGRSTPRDGADARAFVAASHQLQKSLRSHRADISGTNPVVACPDLWKAIPKAHALAAFAIALEGRLVHFVQVANPALHRFAQGLTAIHARASALAGYATRLRSVTESLALLSRAKPANECVAIREWTAHGYSAYDPIAARAGASTRVAGAVWFLSTPLPADRALTTRLVAALVAAGISPTAAQGVTLEGALAAARK